MTIERLFMTTVAVVLGLLALVAAICNHDVCYRLPKARFIESLWGRNGARIAYALLGLTLLALGYALAVARR
jgi:small neutral amino acid transporter SnatA (MarC family)